MPNTIQNSNLKKKMFLLAPFTIILMGLMLFLPAGSFKYWQAWVLIAILSGIFIFVVTYFLRKDPGLLERRMQFKEKEARQKAIIKIVNLFFLAGFIIPGFDYRYGWSKVPIPLVIAADIIIILGYLLIFFVFRENSYTSRTVEVAKGQKVITTGPYSAIRHPMYAGMIPMFICMPLALGSFVALPFFIPIIIGIIFRILNEEKVLTRDLKGYKEYCEKVRFRLLPGVW